jgi:hypothetical protein
LLRLRVVGDFSAGTATFDKPYERLDLVPRMLRQPGGEYHQKWHLQSTISLWYLYSDSELQQDGDTGGTVASKQPSNRYGSRREVYITPVYGESGRPRSPPSSLVHSVTKLPTGHRGLPDRGGGLPVG